MSENTHPSRVAAMTQGVVSAVAEYVERGWRVVPVANKGCNPLVELVRIIGGPPSDRRQIAHWWQLWPYAAVGIATGQPSGLVVVSVPRVPSTPVRRFAWRSPSRRARLIRSLPGDLPQTVVVGHTGRLHYYYTAPDRPIPTCAMGDIRIFGEAGVVLAPPPSIHSESPQWECALSATSLSPAPAWVAALAT